MEEGVWWCHEGNEEIADEVAITLYGDVEQSSKRPSCCSTKSIAQMSLEYQ